MRVAIDTVKEILDAVRQEDETDAQVVTRCVADAARSPLRTKYRAAEKAKLDKAAREAAEQTVRDAIAADADADADADAQVERLLA